MIVLFALALVAAQTTSAGQIGITSAANATVKGEPATFDLAGFRLGMSEVEIEHVLRTRGMTVLRRGRSTTFEDNVRGLANVRGGRLPMKGGNVLAAIELDDGKGGRVMLRMLAWPDGARVHSVTYIPPAGTELASWRSLLVERFGAPARDADRMDGDGLHLAWCGQGLCEGRSDIFRLDADVNARGGSVALSQPDNTAQSLSRLVEEAAAKRIAGGPPIF